MEAFGGPLKTKASFLIFLLTLTKHFRIRLITQNGHFKFYHPIKVFAQERIFANNLDANCKNVENLGMVKFPSINFNCFEPENSYHWPASFCLNNNHGTDLAFLMLAGLLMEL